MAKQLFAGGKGCILSPQQMDTARLFTYLLWIVPAILQIAIAWKMYSTRLAREFPFFFTYTVLHLFRFAILFSTYLWMRSYKTYFVEYWAAEAVDIVLGLAIIYEIYSHVFRQYAALQKLATLLFQWCAALLVLLATVVAATSPGTDASRLIAGIFTVEQCFAIVRAGLLLFLFVFARTFGLQLRHYVFGIALGFAVYVSTELGTTAMRGHLGSVAASTYAFVKSGAFNCSVLIWVVYFFLPQPQTISLAAAPKNDLEQWNQALVQLLNK